MTTFSTGYAIVSSDFKIADKHHEMPDDLEFPGDLKRLHSMLADDDLQVLARRTDDDFANPHNRPRMILSHSKTADHPLNTVQKNDHEVYVSRAQLLGNLNILDCLEKGVRLAVLGGQSIYTMFARDKLYDRFELTLARDVEIPDGHPIIDPELGQPHTVEDFANLLCLSVTDRHESDDHPLTYYTFGR